MAEEIRLLRFAHAIRISPDGPLPHYTREILADFREVPQTTIPFEQGRPHSINIDGSEVSITVDRQKDRWKIVLESRDSRRFFGLGMNFRRFVLRNETVTLQNRDSPYFLQRWFSYANIPWAASDAGWAFLLLDASTLKVRFVQGRRVEITGVRHPDLFLFGGGLRNVVRQLTSLTGRPPLPPRWAFGLWNTSFPCPKQDEVLSYARDFHRRKIPLDTIILDYHWEEKFHNFRWNPFLFPDPPLFLEKARKAGLKIGLITTPFVNRREHFPFRLFVRAISGPNVPAGMSLFHRYADRALYDLWNRKGAFLHADAPWWFGRGGMIDFSGTAGDDVWSEKARSLLDSGVRFFKNDDGEYVPPDSLTSSGITADEMHNAYGFYYARSMYRTCEEAYGRGLAYARSVWTGAQKTPGIFLGDQQPNERGMARSLNAGLSLSLAGFSFWTADLFGLAGSVSRTMHRRHVDYASLVPIARHFSSTADPTRDPWHYGPGNERFFRSRIRRRYRLLPLYYSLADEAWNTGMPILRPGVLVDAEYSGEEKDAAVFLIGDDLLACPLPENRAQLPAGEWVQASTGALFRTGDVIPPGDHMPVFVRRPSVLPYTAPRLTLDPAETPGSRDPNAAFIGERGAPVVLAVQTGGRCSFTLYDDLGTGTGYKNGEFARVRIDWEESEGGGTISLEQTSGILFHPRRFVIRLYGLKRPPQSAETAAGNVSLRTRFRRSPRPASVGFRWDGREGISIRVGF